VVVAPTTSRWAAVVPGAGCKTASQDRARDDEAAQEVEHAVKHDDLLEQTGPPAALPSQSLDMLSAPWHQVES